MNVSAENVHVLYINGDFDDAPPDTLPKRGLLRCVAADAWLPLLDRSTASAITVTVIGWTNPS
jgi:hypothetical protein